jgi:PKD repeat protein
MGKREQFYIVLATFLFFSRAYCQTIPIGWSVDSNVIVKGKFVGPYASYNNNPFMTYYPDAKYVVHYYKPMAYDPANSPILWYNHGTGGTGAEGAIVQQIAEHRNALIVAPNGLTILRQMAMDLIDDTIYSRSCYPWYDTILPSGKYTWLTQPFKQIYRNVLQKEGRDSIPVYFTGWSAGAQLVTRYMLMRQFSPDSINIKMAVSANPYVYLFCKDTFSGQGLNFPFGLARGLGISEYDCHLGEYDTIDLHWLCNEHVIQYYNENYGVLIGTADTGFLSSWALGDNRYERAQNFYNFSDTNAITRGTTLKWVYDTVSGVGHDAVAMFNTPAPGDSISIAERMLFETPWHPVPNTALVVDFSVDTNITSVPGGTIQFYNNSINATSFLWDFGDGTTSTAVSPPHTYAYPDTFDIKLTATSGLGCENTLVKKNEVIVRSTTAVKDYARSEVHFSIYPNPVNETANLAFVILEKENVDIIVYNSIGEKVKTVFTGRMNENSVQNITLYAKDLPDGIYFVSLRTSKDFVSLKFALSR